MPNSNQEIMVLEENTIGQDLLIGDVHGAYACFDQLLQDVFAQKSFASSKDRLFIVGDLTDRGEASALVLNRIIAINNDCHKNNLPSKIVVIRGNHEEMLLRYLKLKIESDELIQQGSSLPLEKKPVFDLATQHFEANGGDWLTKHPEKFSHEKLIEYREFLDHLPYIVHVKGASPFNVVHADMPINDQTLQSKILSNDLTLTPEQKKYCAWAREADDVVPIQSTGRNQTSHPTYCGHTIFGGVRSETNHINLDIGSYFSNTLLMVNHTKGAVELYKDPVQLSAEDEQAMEIAINGIQHTLLLHRCIILKKQLELATQDPLYKKQPGKVIQSDESYLQSLNQMDIGRIQKEETTLIHQIRETLTNTCIEYKDIINPVNFSFITYQNDLNKMDTDTLEKEKQLNIVELKEKLIIECVDLKHELDRQSAVHDKQFITKSRRVSNDDFKKSLVNQDISDLFKEKNALIKSISLVTEKLKLGELLNEAMSECHRIAEVYIKESNAQHDLLSTEIQKQSYLIFNMDTPLEKKIEDLNQLARSHDSQIKTLQEKNVALETEKNTLYVFIAQILNIVADYKSLQGKILKQNKLALIIPLLDLAKKYQDDVVSGKDNYSEMSNVLYQKLNGTYDEVLKHHTKNNLSGLFSPAAQVGEKNEKLGLAKIFNNILENPVLRKHFESKGFDQRRMRN